MKKAILSLHILFIFNLAHAQNFLNGNFENTTANCQINTTNNSFNGFMTNCYGFGSDGLDILTNSLIFFKKIYKLMEQHKMEIILLQSLATFQ